ncbi:MAG: hypothetical protein U0452_06035 [Anaerolineae bacterium]
MLDRTTPPSSKLCASQMGTSGGETVGAQLIVAEGAGSCVPVAVAAAVADGAPVLVAVGVGVGDCVPVAVGAGVVVFVAVVACS